MKLQLLIIFFAAITLTSCFKFDLFPDRTVVYRGRIVEAYNSAKPVDSVLVQGCVQTISFIPSWPSCDTETFTDSNGHFYISFEADGMESRGILYYKEGYSSLDSCKKMPDGTLECYLQPLPTGFHVYSPTKTDQPFIYDSLVIHVQTTTRDTTVHYSTGSFQNIYGSTSYYWTTNPKLSPALQSSYTSFIVVDNTSVTVDATYFKNKNEVKQDHVKVFCPKGLNSHYKILDN